MFQCFPWKNCKISVTPFGFLFLSFSSQLDTAANCIFARTVITVHQLLITICCERDDGSRLQESVCLGRVNIFSNCCCVWLASYLFMPVRSLNFLSIAEQVNRDTQICFPAYAVEHSWTRSSLKWQMQRKVRIAGFWTELPLLGTGKKSLVWLFSTRVLPAQQLWAAHTEDRSVLDRKKDFIITLSVSTKFNRIKPYQQFLH